MPETFHLLSLVGSATPFAVYPEWDGYEERRIPVREQHRTETGAMHTVDHGAYLAYTVPLAMVTSAQAFELNTWWADHREILFVFSMSSNPKSVTCRIENDTAPMAQYARPRRDLYGGTLFLREIRGTVEPFSGGLFITDDAFWGLTDQTYNVTP